MEENPDVVNEVSNEYFQKIFTILKKYTLQILLIFVAVAVAVVVILLKDTIINFINNNFKSTTYTQQLINKPEFTQPVSPKQQDELNTVHTSELED